jgi:GTPase SAR1 family protein
MSYLEDEIKKTDKLFEDLVDNKVGKKILFTGLSQSGKSSIIQTVFEGRNPETTIDLKATVGFTRKQVDYTGISLFIFDLGGQISYLEDAFNLLKESMFSNLEYLLFVVDIANFGEFDQAKLYFFKALRNVEEFGKGAKIAVLAHKMDLIPDEEKEERINTLSMLFGLNNLENVEIYQTSIYDSSIYEAIEAILQ